MSNLYTLDRTAVAPRARQRASPLQARRLAGFVLLAAGFTMPLAAPAQAETFRAPAPGSVEEAAASLVADALASNLELDGAGAGVAQRIAALDQARALYLPSLDFSARYTGASGGRTLDFPVGDLLNPVYATLNQITGTTKCPAIQNQQVNFQRTREQYTDLLLTQHL